jgi:hypothetical protein
VFAFAKPASRMPVPGEVHTARHGGQRQDRKGVAGAVSMVWYAMLPYAHRARGQPRIVVDVPTYGEVR